MTAASGRVLASTAGTRTATGTPCLTIVIRAPFATRLSSRERFVFASYTPTRVISPFSIRRSALLAAPEPPHRHPRQASDARTTRAPSTIARIFARASQRGSAEKPQSAVTVSRGAGTCSSTRRIRAATSSGVSS